ncbi:hypothetical protein [Paracoccus sp. (in: a-proteobacteria)]|uniref:hypothetical protein n=1 Tax=Paracoccus sp. TaxID=267 RepID=UPI0032427B33
MHEFFVIFQWFVLIVWFHFMKLSKTCLRLIVGLPKHRFTEGGNAGGAGQAALRGVGCREEILVRMAGAGVD